MYSLRMSSEIFIKRKAAKPNIQQKGSEMLDDDIAKPP